MIGIFDSGIGGISVLKEIRRQLPEYSYLYFADQIHVPYGSRSLAEVKKFSEEITRFLLRRGASLIVVACNTASGAALRDLRELLPEIPFVGMEPAVKPAVMATKTNKIGVIATQATFNGNLYPALVERYGQDVEIFEDPCIGLASKIEQGPSGMREARKILERAVRPMREAGIDVLVLGCTHYPLIRPVIQEIVGEHVQIIDPAPAIARQVQRLLEEYRIKPDPEAVSARYFTSGDTEVLRNALRIYLNEASALVGGVKWDGDLLAD
ncbi:MAG: glutamate racemase [Anaerolineaceae bacterium]|nr:glutamate racemase [Anaerolineaceae bacterium]